MSGELLKMADHFFIVFHTFLICFNLFAWIWKPLRKWHLAVISLTLASWVFLGIWYGWGYCLLTDWHWEVLRKSGIQDLPDSYISYILQRFFGLNFKDKTVDGFTLVFALLAFLVSIKVNFFSKGL
ncbi:DUF2784 domain-containing protein [Aquiflexum gelatinilyticum]|uniref:DUF2784 domain-containing protein n=1 Tax=Aquiflexum gelatinilyticum TaxID=2961943 RepID=A0A9X2P6L0_9BACT|nr:DUF2784 domain-containing protein [Aquiflexum gelatinilyticum]MCR9016988.1 DUF2784 domain-containing protein [Aquiflexum gelatinilyticum]